MLPRLWPVRTNLIVSPNLRLPFSITPNARMALGLHGRFGNNFPARTLFR